MAHERHQKGKIMKALSKVERARETVSKYIDPFDTDEKKIAELMKQRDPAVGCVAVNRYEFIDALIREYKVEKATVAHLGPACAALLKRAEEAESREADLIISDAKLVEALVETKHANENLSSEVERLMKLVVQPAAILLPDPEPIDVPPLPIPTPAEPVVGVVVPVQG